jgi:antitoxin FitA
MAKMIQIRHVPESLHRKLKARSALQGQSLSDYLLQELQLVAQRPTMDELMERIVRRPSLKLSISAAAMVRAERDRV